MITECVLLPDLLFTGIAIRGLDRLQVNAQGMAWKWPCALAYQ